MSSTIDMITITILIHWTVAVIVVEKTTTMPGAFEKAKEVVADVSATKVTEVKAPEAKVAPKVADVVPDVATKGSEVVPKDNKKGVAPIDTAKATMAIKVVQKDNKNVDATVDAFKAVQAIKEWAHKSLNKDVDVVDNGFSTVNKASAIKEASAKEQDCSEVKNLMSIKDAANTRAAADAVREAEHEAKRQQELARLKRVDAIARATAAVSNVNLDRFAAQLEAAKQRWEADKKQKKLVVLQEHQGKAFARWAKRVARDDKEAAAKSKIKALELRIEALEKAVGAGRAHEVQAASVGGEEEKEEKEVVEEEKVEETPREERSELVKDVVKPAVGAKGPDVFTTGASEEEVAEEIVAVAAADEEEVEIRDEREEQAAAAVSNEEDVEESQEAQVGLPSAETQTMEGVAQFESVSMEEVAGDREDEVTGDYEMEGQESYSYQVTIESSLVVPTISVQLPVTPYKTPENALVIALPPAWREIAQYDDELVESDDASTYGEDEEMDFTPEQDEENLEELALAVEGLGLYEADIVMQPVVESSFAPEFDMEVVHDVPVEQEDLLAMLARVATEVAVEEQQAAEQREEQEERQRQELTWVEFLAGLASVDFEHIPDNNTDIPNVGNVELEVDAPEPESTTVQPWEVFSLEDHLAFIAEGEAAAEPQEEQLWEGEENRLFNDEVDYRESDEASGSDADADGETDSEYIPVQEERGRGGYPSEDEDDDDTRSNGSSVYVVGRDAGGQREQRTPSVGDFDSEEEDEDEEEEVEEEERAQEEPVGHRFVGHDQQHEVADDEVDERVREAPIVPRQDRVIRPLRRRPLAPQQEQVIDPEVLRMEAEARTTALTQEELQIRARYDIAYMRDNQDGVFDSDTDGEWDRVFDDDKALAAELASLRARRGEMDCA